jgi:hypothetical protein
MNHDLQLLPSRREILQLSYQLGGSGPLSTAPQWQLVSHNIVKASSPSQFSRMADPKESVSGPERGQDGGRHVQGGLG